MQLPGDGAGQGVFDQGTLARSADPGDAGQGAQRDPQLDVVEVVQSSPVEFQPGSTRRIGVGRLGRSHSSVGGDRDRATVGEELAGQRPGLAGQFIGRSLRDDLAAVLPGCGSEIDQPIGRFEHFAVVFDHHQRVAEIPKTLESSQQPTVVPGVQADGGFVEYVEHPGQGATDLAGQPDSLALASRKRGKWAVEAEVIESDVDQELQPADRFPQQVPGDSLLITTQPHAAECFQGLVERQSTQRADGLAEQSHGGHVGSEPAAVAGGAIDLAYQIQQTPAVGRRDP